MAKVTLFLVAAAFVAIISANMAGATPIEQTIEGFCKKLDISPECCELLKSTFKGGLGGLLKGGTSIAKIKEIVKGDACKGSAKKVLQLLTKAKEGGIRK